MDLDLEIELRAAAAGAARNGTLREFLLKWANQAKHLSEELKRHKEMVKKLAAEAGYKEGYPPK